MFDLLGNVIGSPTQHRRNQFGHFRGCRVAAVGHLDGDAGTTGEDVVEMLRTLMARSVVDLRLEVLGGGVQRLPQFRSRLDEFEQLVSQSAVPTQ